MSVRWDKTLGMNVFFPVKHETERGLIARLVSTMRIFLLTYFIGANFIFSRQASARPIKQMPMVMMKDVWY